MLRKYAIYITPRVISGVLSITTARYGKSKLFQGWLLEKHSPANSMIFVDLLDSTGSDGQKHGKSKVF